MSNDHPLSPDDGQGLVSGPPVSGREFIFHPAGEPPASFDRREPQPILFPGSLPSIQVLQVVAVDPTKANVCLVTIDREDATHQQCTMVRDYLKEQLAPVGIQVVLVMSDEVKVTLAQQEDPEQTALLKQTQDPEAWEHGLRERIDDALSR